MVQDFERLSASFERGTHFEVLTLPRASKFLVMAPHGGTIELLTDEIARRIAGSNHSLYCFMATTGEDAAWDLRIPSTRFDEPEAIRMAGQSEMVISIHGCSDRLGSYVYVGGLHQELKSLITQRLREADFIVHTPAPENFAGVRPENICNRGSSGMGVQIELSRDLRLELSSNPDRLNVFVRTVRHALSMLAK